MGVLAKDLWETWETMPDCKQKYQAYLSSREWSALEKSVRKRSGGMCERRCGNPASQVRHQTYAKLYQEKPEDLLHVCAACDAYLGDTRNPDPFLKAPVRADGKIVKTVYLAGKITGTTWRDDLFNVSHCSIHGADEGGWAHENHSGIDNDALHGDWVTSDDCLVLPDNRRLSLTGPYWKELSNRGGHGSIGPAVEWIPSKDGDPDGQEEVALDTAHAYIPLEAVYGTDTVVRRADFEEWPLTQEMRGLHAMIVRTIRASDVLFAWIDSLDCYGTLHEIGLALGHGKLVIVACHRDLDTREIWLSCHGARLFVKAASPREAWNKAWNNFDEQDRARHNLLATERLWLMCSDW